MKILSKYAMIKSNEISKRYKNKASRYRHYSAPLFFKFLGFRIYAKG